MHKQQLLDSAISGFLDLLQTRIQEEEFNVNPDNLAVKTADELNQRAVFRTK